jgi:hypothetical protein
MRPVDATLAIAIIGAVTGITSLAWTAWRATWEWRHSGAVVTVTPVWVALGPDEPADPPEAAGVPFIFIGSGPSSVPGWGLRVIIWNIGRSPTTIVELALGVLDEVRLFLPEGDAPLPRELLPGKPWGLMVPSTVLGDVLHVVWHLLPMVASKGDVVLTVRATLGNGSVVIGTTTPHLPPRAGLTKYPIIDP